MESAIGIAVAFIFGIFIGLPMEYLGLSLPELDLGVVLILFAVVALIFLTVFGIQGADGKAKLKMMEAEARHVWGHNVSLEFVPKEEWKDFRRRLTRA